MQLEKWYADSVTDTGAVVVRYLAQLRWRGLCLGYQGAIRHTGGQPQARWRLGGIGLPQRHAAGVDWPAPRPADAPLRYTAQCSGAPVLLHQTSTGAQLVWEPVVCNGVLQLPGAGPARGYVERLTLDFAPWALGLQRLLWGRFCGQRHALVWIVWQGALPQSLAWLDGAPCGALDFADGCITTPQGARLCWRQAQPLLHETLAQGSLRHLALLRAAPLLRFLQARQTKWHAPAQLLGAAGQAPDVGHMVFEEVLWP